MTGATKKFQDKFLFQAKLILVGLCVVWSRKGPGVEDNRLVIAPALPANIRLSCKGSSRTNTLAYLSVVERQNKKVLFYCHYKSMS